MIVGALSILYSKKPDQDREFLREVLAGLISKGFRRTSWGAGKTHRQDHALTGSPS